jgi:hypothetical protein
MNWNKWYKCRECGHVFRECDLGTIEEKHFLDGHYAGSEHFACCPECNGDYDDAKVSCGWHTWSKCLICRRFFCDMVKNEQK